MSTLHLTAKSGHTAQLEFQLGSEDADLAALCGEGLMKDHGPQAIAGGMHCFTVTAAGVAAMKRESPKPPKVSRSRARYLQFLDADCDCTFGEWLRNQWYLPPEPYHDPRSEL